jgi:hypothetical protein
MAILDYNSLDILTLPWIIEDIRNERINSDLDRILTHATFELYVINTYFDSKDLDNPVKTFPSLHQIYLYPDFTKNVDIILG